MLKHLIIQQYAIIPELQISFDRGLTIITGETGAGKSILLGALGLALGKRADSRVVPDEASKCVVEAHFDLENNSVKDIFDREGLDYDQTLISRREISPGGKSRSFINDTPVSLKTVQEITSRLIELHHQHDNLALQSRDNQISILDTLSGSSSLSEQYREHYHGWMEARSELTRLMETEKESVRRKEFLQFQINELDQAKMVPGEIVSLEESQLMLEHAESIQQAIYQLQTGLQDGPHAMLTQLNQLLRQVQPVEKYFAPLADISKRLTSLQIELQDLYLEVSRMETPQQSNSAKLQDVQTRLNQLYQLIKKYQCRDEQGLLQRYHELKSELSKLSSVGEEIRKLEQKIEFLNKELIDLGNALHALRDKGTGKIIPRVAALLKELGMPNARFDIVIRLLDEPIASGMDEVMFVFSANKGSELQPIQAVASGGELSRLSLVLKSIYAQEAQLPTVIFDEIDTGISGEVAWRMGQLILDMAKGHQLLMITHSAQIAAHADHQFHVSKITKGKKDISAIQFLTPDQRIQELAKMLSGDPPTKAAVQNAESLLEKVKVSIA